MTLAEAILAVVGGQNLNDGLISYFRANGGTGESYQDLERSWLIATIGSPQLPATNNDLWMQLTSAYEGSRNDRELQWWLAGGGGGSLRDQVIDLFPKYSALGGMWDFSDITTLSQDDAGTVPVTAASQPVGRALDLSGNSNPMVQTISAARPIFNGNGVTPNGVNQFMRSVADISLVGCDKVVAAAGYIGATGTATWMQLEFGFTEFGTFYLAAGLGAPGRFDTASCIGLVGADPSQDAFFAINNPLEYGAHISRHSIPGDLSEVWWNGLKGTDGVGDKGTGTLTTRPIHMFSRFGVGNWSDSPSRKAVVIAVPVAQPQVSDDDIELIRQWMMEGA